MAELPTEKPENGDHAKNKGSKFDAEKGLQHAFILSLRAPPVLTHKKLR